MLRRFLIGIVIAVSLAVLLNYLHTWRLRAAAVKKAVKILGSEMLRSVESIEYSDNRQGVPRFKIRAKRLLETREGKSHLQGIEAFDFNPDGSVRNEINSQNADYDREANTADFSGDVRVFLSDGFELRTSALHYDFSRKVGNAPNRLQFISKRATGSATGVTLDQKSDFMELQRDVDLVLKGDGGRNAAGRGHFHAVASRAFSTDAMRRIVFQGSARVESGTDSLAADRIEAVLGPDRNSLKSLMAAGNVIFRSGEPDKSQTLRGDHMAFVLSKGQSLERIRVTGRAEYSLVSPSEEAILRGNEIDLHLDPRTTMPLEVQSRKDVLFHSKRSSQQIDVSGQKLTANFLPGGKALTGVTVREKAVLTLDASGDSMVNELQSDEIRVKFQNLDGRAAIDSLRAEGSTRWLSGPKSAGKDPQQKRARTLNAALVEMIFAQGGDFLDRGSASGNVTISETGDGTSSPSQLRRLSSDQIQFQFYPANNRLRNMKASGHVRATYEKTEDSGKNAMVERLQTTSEKMEAAFGLRGDASVVDSAVQWGSFRFEDDSRSATAGRCEYNAQTGILRLTESPRVVDTMISTTGERMEYELQQGVMSVYGRVQSWLQSKRSMGSLLKTSSAASAIITADSLKYWMKERRARYSGKALVLDEGTQLRADTLDILQGGERVEAHGAISHLIPPRTDVKTGVEKVKDQKDPLGGAMTVRCAGLSYSKLKNIVTYSGAVRVVSKDFNLYSEKLDAVIAESGGSIDHATASGKVVIRQGKRECRGDIADYSLNPPRFVLTGSPAEVIDPQKGLSKAGRLTSFIADDRILLEGR
jgi:lipopolysaccharide export system protein LptA